MKRRLTLIKQKVQMELFILFYEEGLFYKHKQHSYNGLSVVWQIIKQCPPPHHWPILYHNTCLDHDRYNYVLHNIIHLFYYIDNININMYKHEYKLNRSLKMTQCVLLVGNNVISWNVFNAHQMIPDICTLSTLILKMPTNFQII